MPDSRSDVIDSVIMDYFFSNSAASQTQRTASRQLNESTKKLFKAIDDGNLEGFKQALTEDADVNAFDKGMTPLMTIIMNGDDRSTCLGMMMLLLQHRDLDVNIQEAKERNTALHMAFLMENKNFIQILLRHPNLNLGIKNNYNDCYNIDRSYTPKEHIEQIGRARKRDFSHLTIEIQKAQKGKDLLNALASRNIYRAERLLNEELNPNCWRRDTNGEIETPLSLIIKSCLRRITRDNEEVLTKLLKHKDLDFSQIKPIQDIERNLCVRQIIEQAIKERLTDAINKKDLDDVKKLVKDNCFMNRAIVTAALRGVDDLIESIKNYLNEKFPASAEQPLANAHNVTPEANDAFIAQELQRLENLKGEFERAKAQLTGKEQELDRIMRERTRDINKISQLERDLSQEKSEQQTRIKALTDQVTQLTRENAQLRTQNKSLNDKNEKPSEASARSRRLSNCASASFILFGICAVGACLTIDYPYMSAFLAGGALGFFLVGCFFLYKANKQDIEPSDATDNPRITRVLIFSPDSVGNLYTC